MIRLCLINFRCYQNKIIQFPENGLILVKGASGIGKSTIFQAIAWVLYGNLQHVVPHTAASNTKTAVELDYGHYILRRQKRPELLKFTIDDKEYEDKVAQEKIIEVFGPREVWMSCCYIQQGQRCPLLSLSNNDKLDTLYKLSFFEDDPDYYISKIENEIREATTECEVQRKLYEDGCNKLDQEITDSGLTMDDAMDEEQLKTERDIIVKLEKEIHVWQQKSIEHKISSGKKTILEQRKGVIATNLDKITLEHTEENLIEMNKAREWKRHVAELDQKREVAQGIESVNVYDEMKKELQQCEIYQEQTLLREQLKNYNDVLQELGDFIGEDQIEEWERQLCLEMKKKSVSPLINQLQMINVELQCDDVDEKLVEECKDCLSILDQRKLIEDQMSKLNCKVHGNLEELKRKVEEKNKYKPIVDELLLPYEEDAVKEFIIHATDEVEGQLERKIAAKVMEIIEEYNKNLGEDVTTEQVFNCRNHYETMLKSRDNLQCPRCSIGLRYRDGCLIHANEKPVTEKELQSVLEHLSKLQLDEECTKIRTGLKEKLDENMQKCYVDIHNLHKYKLPLSDEDFEKKNKQLVMAKTVKVIKVNYSLDEINEAIEYTQFQHELSALPEVKHNRKYCEETLRKHEDISHTVRIYSKKKQEVQKEIVKIWGSLDITAGEFSDVNIQSLQSLLNDVERKNTEIRKYEKLKQEITLGEIPEMDYHPERHGFLKSLTTTRQAVGNYEDLSEKKLQQVDSEYTLEELNLEIKHGEMMLAKYYHLQMDLEDIEKDISELYSCPEAEIHCEECLKTYEDKKVKVDRGTRFSKFLHYQKELEKKRQCLIETTDKFGHLHRMKTLFIEKECDVLTKTVASINNVLVDVCTTIFDVPIEIYISLYKTSKSNQRTKPNVNLQIKYRGGVFSNINQLSGGEGDRISLAITIALSRLNSSPFLILDECISSLDADIKELCIECLKRNAGGKLVLCVNHDGTEGYYDDTISPI